MEKFFKPINIRRFVKWTLDQANYCHWICVVEYSEPAILTTLKKHAVLIDSPKTASRNYSDTSMLIAFEPKNASLEFIKLVIANSHVLSVYKDNDLLLLIADDYHSDCFSCSTEFYDQYGPELKGMKLVGA